MSSLTSGRSERGSLCTKLSVQCHHAAQRLSVDILTFEHPTALFNRLALQSGKQVAVCSLFHVTSNNFLKASALSPIKWGLNGTYLMRLF